ncbi:hypothetical protein KKF34_15265 [Myxococcota bacterium]|nr:hypothetical protein [Myxococcota bacterium]MBU1498237.1 hypothetical protein [Myxococcota bacterium]
MAIRKIFPLFFLLMISLTGCGQKGSFGVTVKPTKYHFVDLEKVVDGISPTMPNEILKKYILIKPSEFRKGVSLSWSARIIEYDFPFKKERKPLQVELSIITVASTLKDFENRIGIQNWGRNLEGYKGGEIIKVSSSRKEVRQIERMVLSGGNDMTKVEIIKYHENRMTVYWRVYWSDNSSTVSDVGRLDVYEVVPGELRISFLSAHDVRYHGLFRLPGFLLRWGLENTFLGHLKHYRKILSRGSK